jgi:hypothetical protein
LITSARVVASFVPSSHPLSPFVVLHRRGYQGRAVSGILCNRTHPSVQRRCMKLVKPPAHVSILRLLARLQVTDAGYRLRYSLIGRVRSYIPWSNKLPCIVNRGHRVGVVSSPTVSTKLPQPHKIRLSGDITRRLNVVSYSTVPEGSPLFSSLSFMKTSSRTSYPEVHDTSIPFTYSMKRSRFSSGTIGFHVGASLEERHECGYPQVPWNRCCRTTTCSTHLYYLVGRYL